jgi:hypothetical protein
MFATHLLWISDNRQFLEIEMGLGWVKLAPNAQNTANVLSAYAVIAIMQQLEVQ